MKNKLSIYSNLDIFYDFFKIQDCWHLFLLNVIISLPIAIIPVIASDVLDQIFSNPIDSFKIYLNFTIAFFIIILFFPIRYFYKLLLFSFRRNQKYKILNKLRTNLLTCSFDDFIKNDHGYYISIFNNDVSNITDFIITIIENFPPIILAIIFSLGVTILLLPQFILFYILAIPSLFLLYIFSQKYLIPLYQSYSQSRNKFNHYLIEMLNLATYTKIHFLQIRELKRGKSFECTMKKKERSYDTTDSLVSALSWLIIALWNLFALAGIIILKLFSTRELSLGNIILLQGSSNAILGACLTFSNIISRVTNGIVSYNNIKKVTTSVSHTSLRFPKPAFIKGNITFNNVFYEYPNNLFAIKNCSFSIPASSWTCIVGPSGAGKSTIVKLLLGLLNPSNGEILIDNINIQNYEQYLLRRNISFVPQNVYLFSGSIRENIVYGDINYSKSNLDKAIKIAGLETFISQCPQGLETPLIGNKENLSGGEKQRIAIARALYRNPKILILDETMSGLDLEVAQHLHQSLKELKSNTTIILITHTLHLTQEADQILVVANGQICEKGTHDQLLHIKGLYAHLYRC